MKTTTETPLPETRNAVAPAPAPASSNGHDKARAANRKMVHRLQDAIDDRGRYSYQLRDLATGYAAAKGITEYAAKLEIGAVFEKEIGVTLKQYLDEHRLERGLEVDVPRGR